MSAAVARQKAAELRAAARVAVKAGRLRLALELRRAAARLDWTAGAAERGWA